MALATADDILLDVNDGFVGQALIALKMSLDLARGDLTPDQSAVRQTLREASAMVAPQWIRFA